MIRKYGLNMLALVIAVSAAAFTNKPVVHSSTSSTYYYAGSVFDDAHYDVAGNWNKTVLTCTTGPKLCSVVAPDGSGSHPDFSGMPPGHHVSTDNTIISGRTFKN
jgi:hypothetical protein